VSTFSTGRTTVRDLMVVTLSILNPLPALLP
jgi:hypothetical protein